MPVEPIAPAAAQIQCADGSVIASTETCPESESTSEDEDEDEKKVME